MTLRPILIHPDPRLKKRAQPVADITGELRALADDMLETMYDAPGIGLAAPQLGISKRLLVMDCTRDDDAPRRPMTLINPELIWRSDDRVTTEEGCLSLPEEFAEVTRHDEVGVRWLDRDGAMREDRFTGLWSRCVQHEIDHLDGRLFIDHLGAMRRQMITRRMAKHKREKARA